MKKGDFIKLHRKNANMTQDQLSLGICSVSYLSKIENNDVIPSEQIRSLLFSRLGMNQESSFEEETETLHHDLTAWYQSIENFQIIFKRSRLWRVIPCV
ncbi:helix-turn-helix domain-containing protein [Aquibacillus sediminis]|uniref:helix-turn-helix domain-containing protein n=1 Tax=Aquibacillus sediminis TaxID=2574734 RepID=UPI0011081D19|nr:helix-turn-helix transcriptional regulator [Aquibacillus sediminis]